MQSGAHCPHCPTSLALAEATAPHCPATAPRMHDLIEIHELPSLTHQTPQFDAILEQKSHKTHGSYVVLMLVDAYFARFCRALQLDFCLNAAMANLRVFTSAVWTNASHAFRPSGMMGCPSKAMAGHLRARPTWRNLSLRLGPWRSE